MTSDYWDSFHENLFQRRRDLIRRFIAEGAVHPPQVLGQMYSHERLHPPDEGLHRQVIGDNGDGADGGPLNPNKFPRLPTGVPAFKYTWVRGQVAIIPYYDKPVQFLVDFLADKEFDAVVELGSGDGRNLIELYYAGGPRGIRYYAGEIAASGIEVTTLLSELADGLDLVPFQFDLAEPDLRPVRETGRLFVFTNSAIEQVAFLPANFFSNLTSQADHVVGVHMEPIGFQLTNSPNQADHYLSGRNKVRGYNLNMAKVLLDSARRGEIKLTYLGPDILGGRDIPVQKSLVVWSSP